MRECAQHEEESKGQGQKSVDKGVQVILVPVVDVEDDARNHHVRPENDHLDGSEDGLADHASRKSLCFQTDGVQVNTMI